MDNPSFDIAPVTRAQVNVLLDKLRANATVTNPRTDTWSIVGHGVTATASYVEANQILSVLVTSKPFYISIGMIESQLKEQLGVPR